MFFDMGIFYLIKMFEFSQYDFNPKGSLASNSNNQNKN